MQVLKVKYGEDTRRVTIQSIPTFAELSSLLEKLFNVNGFTVKYEDEDKDLITVSTDLELKEAFAVASKQPNGVLRLFLFGVKTNSGEPVKDGKKEATPTPPPTSQNNNANPLNFIQDFLKNISQQGPNAQAPDMEKLNEMFNGFGFAANNGQNQQPQMNWQQMQGMLGQLLQNPGIRDMIPSLLSTFSQFANQSQDPMSNMWNGFQPTDENSNSNSNSNENPKDDEEHVIHYGVRCDSCEQTVSGIRYKCSVCPDYDLCEECKKKPNVHDSTHPFQTIAKPAHSGANGSGRGCPYGRYYWPPHRWNNRNPNANKQDKAPNAKHQNLARFVSDVNLPDGTSMAPNVSFVKIWKMRNEGAQAWPEGTRLEHVGGDRLSTLDFIPVPNVNPGEEIDLAVDMTSPSKPGRYVSYWRLSQPDGGRFGQRVWVDVFVTGESTPVKPTEVTSATSTQTSSNSMEVDTPVVVNPPPVVPSAPPVVPSAPPATPEYPPKVAQLLEMGFSDPDRILAFLKKNNDDIMRTVQDLLNNSK